jgi:hypothetical protein
MTIAEVQAPVLTGTWRNTNSESDGVVKIVVTTEGGGVSLELNDSGPIPATVYSERNDEGCEQPFTAAHDFGFKDVVLYGFLRQGVLVLLTFNRFKDGSARSNYFAKEFFYRTDFYST